MVWTRAYENAGKRARLHACSSRYNDPRIDTEAARWAICVSKYCTESGIFGLHQHIAENAREFTVKKVLKLVQSKGEGGITQNELTRSTKFLHKRERQEIVDDLIESNQIIKTTRTSTKGPATVYKAI